MNDTERFWQIVEAFDEPADGRGPVAAMALGFLLAAAAWVALWCIAELVRAVVS